MRIISKAATVGLLALALGGCAGTPPAGEKTASTTTTRHAKCEAATGSMFCGNGEDQPYGSLNGPYGSAPKSNQSLQSQGLGGP